MGPSMFGRVLCVHFGWNFHGRYMNFQCSYLRWKSPGITSQGPRKKAYKKDSRAIETLPWQCQSTSSKWCLVSPSTPHRLGSVLKLSHRRWINQEEAAVTNDGAAGRPVVQSTLRRCCLSMVACNCCHATASLKGWMVNSPYILTWSYLIYFDIFWCIQVIKNVINPFPIPYTQNRFSLQN